MKIKLKLTIFLVVFLNITTTFAQQSTNNKTYYLDTVTLLKKTMSNMPDCIEYCIHELVFKMKKKHGIPYFFWTLNVSHNSPNWLNLTHPELDDTAYIDFNKVYGKAYKKMSELIFKKPVELIAGKKLAEEIGGGRYRHAQWGKHQAVQFSEVVVMGHPGSMILAMFGPNGLKPKGNCRTHGCLENKPNDLGEGIRNDTGDVDYNEDESQAAGENYLNGWLNGNFSFTDPGLLGIFSYMGIHDIIASSDLLSDFLKNLIQLIQSTASSLGAEIDYFFCPMEIAPFIPYYLSGFDSYAWRLGYPVADSEFSNIILNPLSDDIIGTDVTDTVQIASKKIKIPTINEQWGNIYPREGTVNVQNTAKMAAVTAYRANSILSDRKKSLNRIYRKPLENTVGVWSKEVPPIDTTTPVHTVSACHKNIANTGIFIHKNSNYIYTSWPKYRCDLAGGKRILAIPLDICLTRPVPE